MFVYLVVYLILVIVVSLLSTNSLISKVDTIHEQAYKKIFSQRLPSWFDKKLVKKFKKKL